MSKFRRPICPFCGKKLNPLESWAIKTEGEYQCPRCGGCSNIVLSSAARLLALGAVVCGLLLFFISKAVLGYYSLWAVVWVMLPFVAFYALSVFLVRLKKPVFRKAGDEPAHSQRPPTQPQRQPVQPVRQPVQPQRPPVQQRPPARPPVQPRPAPPPGRQFPPRDDRYF